MSTEGIFLFLLFSVFSAAGVLTVLCCRYRLNLHQAHRRLALGETRLATYRRRLGRLRLGVAELEVAGDREAGEELRQRLQLGPQGSSGIVERYRLVGNMVRRGLTAEDISAILQLPLGETEQLLKLAQVGREAERSD